MRLAYLAMTPSDVNKVSNVWKSVRGGVLFPKLKCKGSGFWHKYFSSYFSSYTSLYLKSTHLVRVKKFSSNEHRTAVGEHIAHLSMLF